MNSKYQKVRLTFGPPKTMDFGMALGVDNGFIYVVMKRVK